MFEGCLKGCLKVFEVDGLHFGYFDGNLMVDGHHSFYKE